MSGYRLNDKYYDRLNGALLNYKEGDDLFEIDPWGKPHALEHKRLDQKIQDAQKIIESCNSLKLKK